MHSRYFEGDASQGGRVTENGILLTKCEGTRILKTMPWVRIATVSNVPPGEVIEALHEGEPYAVCNVDGEIRVLSGVCPHAGGPLGQGTLNGSTITCPFHAWDFDSATGVCLVDDTVAVPGFAVRLDGEEIMADLPASPKHA
jgi:nitrite reductase/ring-hydroxylating ferredoxin subunit